MKKRFLTNFTAFILVFIATISHAEVIDKIVAKVGEEAITQNDLNAAMQAKKLSLLQDYGDKQGAALFNQFKANALEEMILAKILQSEIHRENIVVDLSQVDSEFKTRVQASHLTETEFVANLAKFGLSLAAYRDSLKNELEQHKFIEKKIMPSVNVSDYDLQKEYDRNVTKYQTFSKFRFIEAYLTMDSFTSQDELMKTAETIFAGLTQNRPVGELIKKYSSGAFKDKSGDSGIVEATSLRPEIKQVLMTLKPGQAAKPFQLGNGLYLCKLISASDPKPVPFNQVSNIIRQRFGDKAIQQALRKYLLSVRDQTYVEIMK